MRTQSAIILRFTLPFDICCCCCVIDGFVLCCIRLYTRVFHLPYNMKRGNEYSAKQNKSRTAGFSRGPSVLPGSIRGNPSRTMIKPSTSPLTCTTPGYNFRVSAIAQLCIEYRPFLPALTRVAQRALEYIRIQFLPNSFALYRT